MNVIADHHHTPRRIHVDAAPVEPSADASVLRVGLVTESAVVASASSSG
jgi:hypothetical protein